LKKGDFVGREALQRARADGLKRQLVCLVLDDPTAWVLGGEPVLNGNDVVGRVTSGGYGYTVGRSIAYAYVKVDRAAVGTPLQVLWFGESISATVTAEPLFDPSNARIKGLEVAAAAP
jgi:glycine cleavage system aminomethyltransferase T